MPKKTAATLAPTKTDEVPAWLEEAHRVLAEPNDKIDFFGRLKKLPAQAWEKDFLLYLYRTGPTVRNKQGAPKYIAVYTSPVSQEDIKAEHGGGDFWLWLNWGSENLLKYNFAIEGDPKLKEGQTLINPPAAQPQPVQPQNSGSVTPEVIRTIAEVAQNKTGEAAVQQAIGVIGEGAKAGIELATRGAPANDPMAMFRTALEMVKTLTPPPQPPPDPMATLKTAVELVKTLNPERPAREEEDPIDAIGRVKDKLGIDLVNLLQKKNPSPVESSPWVGFFTTLMQNAPVILGQIRQMQQDAYERAMAVARFRAQNGLLGPAPQPAAPVPPGGVPAATPQFPGAIPSPGTAMPEAQPSAAFAGSQVVDFAEMGTQFAALVERSYEKGDLGDVAAVVVKRVMPEVVELMTPFLTDEQKQNEFIASLPALQKLSEEEDWPEFKREFLAELLRDEDAEQQAEHASVPAAEGRA